MTKEEEAVLEVARQIWGVAQEPGEFPDSRWDGGDMHEMVLEVVEVYDKLVGANPRRKLKND